MKCNDNVCMANIKHTVHYTSEVYSVFLLLQNCNFGIPFCVFTCKGFVVKANLKRTLHKNLIPQKIPNIKENMYKKFTVYISFHV